MKSDKYHYMMLISRGEMNIVRVPLPMPTWKRMRRALTPIMHSFGMRQKDISGIDGFVSWDPSERTESDRKDAEKLNDAFAKGTKYFKDFWLWDWNENDGEFYLVREGKRY